MATAPFAGRRARLASSLQELAVDALVVTHLPNTRYLTGFTGSAAILVVEDQGGATLITDSRYLDQLKQEAADVEVHPVAGAYEDTLVQYIDSQDFGSVAYEEAHLRVSQLRLLEAGGGSDFIGCRNLVEKLRAVKDEQEIEILHRAASGLGRALDTLRRKIRPGISERGLAAELDYRLRRHGYEKTSFDTIVASGPRSALPHGRPTDRQLRLGDLVVMDFGGVMEGYASDMTRTFCLGEPHPDTVRIYEVVKEAQHAAIQAIRPGVEAREVDRAARDVIESADFGRFFGHGTGHGIGLEVHEAPWISPRAVDVLEPGMVFTVEPGIYVPGMGGVRLEDDVVVTESGCRLLSRNESGLQDFSWVCYV